MGGRRTVQTPWQLQHGTRYERRQKGALMTLFAIIADGQFDQVVETKPLAEREKRDLSRLGFVVRIIQCAEWATANKIEQQYSPQGDR